MRFCEDSVNENLGCDCVSCSSIKFFSSVDYTLLPKVIMAVVVFFSFSFFMYAIAFRESQGLVVASFWLGCFTSLLVGKEG